MSRVSKLIKDLQTVPGIVGSLGLSIAEAQKAFNLDYLENIEKLLALAYILAAEDVPGRSEADKAKAKSFAAIFQQLIRACAPPRYQYTETTLTVRMDLAQSMDLGLNVGFGMNTGAMVVNAALTIGYSYDYRAAAECRTVIHAIPADPQFVETFLARAKELDARVLDLPERSGVDAKILEQAQNVFDKVLGAAADKSKAADTVPPASEGATEEPTRP